MEGTIGEAKRGGVQGEWLSGTESSREGQDAPGQAWVAARKA